MSDTLYYTLLVNDLATTKELKSIALAFGQRKTIARNVKFADSPVTIDMTEVGNVVAMLVVTTLPVTLTMNAGTIKVARAMFVTLDTTDITSLTISRESVTDDVGADVEIYFWANAAA